MDRLIQDVRFALRTLGRAPGFLLASVLTLALGIGATTAVFSVADTLLLRPLPYPQAERLVVLWGSYPDYGRTRTSLPDLLDWREQSTAFEQLAGFTPSNANLSLAGGEPSRVERAMVTANFFRTLGVSPAAGRFFLPDEERGGAGSVTAGAAVAVVSHSFWQSQMGGTAAAVGREIEVHGRTHTVVGVAPAGFRFRGPTEVWTPLNVEAEADRRSEFLEVVGRLQPGVSLGGARTEMDAVAARLAEAYPATNTTIRVETVSLHEDVVGGVRPAILALLLAVALVLVIACANVANLLLARATARRREIAVRTSLGAGRARIARQLITESLVLSLLGGGAGTVLAVLGVRALRTMQADLIPRFGEVSVDARVLAFTLGIALLTGVAFGLAPALQAMRSTQADALRGGTGAARGVQRLRQTLVAGEVALALVLLMGAGLFLRSLGELSRVDPGFTPEGVLSAQVHLPASQYGDAERTLRFYDAMLERVRSAPGVRDAALGNNFPLSGRAGYWSFVVEGIAPTEGVVQDAQPFSVGTRYFDVLGIPLLAGRAFGDGDHAEAPPVAMVNRTLAERYFAGADPVGRRITFGDPEDPETTWWTVVGVAADVRVVGLGEPPYPQIYRPVAQAPSASMAVFTRADGDPMQLVPAVRQAAHDADPAVPLHSVQPMTRYVTDAAAQPRVGTTLVGLFAAVALVLAAVGVYGVIAFSVAQRTREIGVRMALGAAPATVLRGTVLQGIRPALAGVALGVAAAWGASRAIRGFLYGVSPTDRAAFLVVPVVIALVVFAAAYLPARRAARVDPIVALRAE